VVRKTEVGGERNDWSGDDRLGHRLNLHRP
jgi:hypothetical protein